MLARCLQFCVGMFADKAVIDRGVRNGYGIEPRHYWLIEHADPAAAAAMEERLADAGFTRLRSGLGTAPHLPECP